MAKVKLTCLQSQKNKIKIGVKIMCGFEATKLPPSNVRRNHRLQSTQTVINTHKSLIVDDSLLEPVRRGPEVKNTQ